MNRFSFAGASLGMGRTASRRWDVVFALAEIEVQVAEDEVGKAQEQPGLSQDRGGGERRRRR